MIYQHIRNATAIIEFAGYRFLVDPFLADKGTLPAVPSHINSAMNPTVSLPFSAEKVVSNIDAVIITHMHHFDHFDTAAEKLLNKMIPIFTQNEKERDDMMQLGFQNVTALTTTGLLFKDITLIRTVAEHGRGIEAQQNYEALGLISDASGVILQHPQEGTLYIAGDTLWNETIAQTIRDISPQTIVLNAGKATFADGTPILMGLDGIEQSRKLAPDATIIVVHLEAVNHVTVTRAMARDFIVTQKIDKNIFIPQDGETISLPSK